MGAKDQTFIHCLKEENVLEEICYKDMEKVSEKSQQY
jgi:hypothetical protein